MSRCCSASLSMSRSARAQSATATIVPPLGMCSASLRIARRCLSTFSHGGTRSLGGAPGLAAWFATEVIGVSPPMCSGSCSVVALLAGMVEGVACACELGCLCWSSAGLAVVPPGCCGGFPRAVSGDVSLGWASCCLLWAAGVVCIMAVVSSSGSGPVGGGVGVGEGSGLARPPRFRLSRACG